jgi:carboxyl-terminal processing protease
MKNILRILLVLVFSWSAVPLAAYENDQKLEEVDEKRNKLIGYMLSKQLPSLHFSDKQVDDELATAAFDLYLKQLDFQKRFLLATDAAYMLTFADQIDNNLARGTMVLPETGYGILTRRIGQVEALMRELQGQPIDPTRTELFETDPDKLEYAEDMGALEERWRLILKSQIITRYLELEEEYLAEKKQIDEKELWQEAREKVAKRFEDFFKRLHQETLQDHYDRYFNAVTRAFDPHTNYMAPDRKEDFDIQMRGSLEGIGALLREEDGVIKVVRIIPGSASARQGRLQAEDIILAVAEKGEEPVEITDMRLRNAVRLIRGPKETEVRLTIRKPDGSKEVIPIIRDVVQIEDAFVKHTLLEVDGSTFGYINIPSFYRDFEKSRNGEGRNSTIDTRKAIAALKKDGVEGVILDLRNNGGGSLVDAVEITGLFIDSGPIVQVKNSYGLKRVLEDPDDTLVYGGPLVVMVNKFSASASEIVAAALQDYRRAVIIGGEHTHGKGTVQTIIDLNENIPLLHLRRYDDLGALKATVQKFYRVNGGSTQYRGVEPDIVLPSLFQNLKSGEQYLDYSLPWDQDAPAEYEVYPDKIVNLEQIIEQSRARVLRSKELQLVEAEAVRSAQRSDQTRIAVDVASMRAKRDEERLAREQVGDQYRRLEDESLGQEGGDDGDTGSDPVAWTDDLLKDPYVSEARMIIKDLAGQLQN